MHQRYLIAFISIVQFLFVALGPNSFAEEIPENWTFVPHSKSIIVTPDFCELCMCCETSAEIYKFKNGALPQSFGTTEFPPLIKKDSIDAIKRVESLKVEGISEKEVEDMLSAAGTRALIDVCELCKCCVETPDTLVIDKGAGNLPRLQDYRAVFE